MPLHKLFGHHELAVYLLSIVSLTVLGSRGKLLFLFTREYELPSTHTVLLKSSS